jgi:CubicO group peptidase (beta-lactamase class C family)
MTGAVFRSVLAASIVLASAIANSSAKSPDGLAGLWGVETSFGPSLRGELTIDGRAADWRASLAGFSAPVRREGDRVRFEIPGGGGEFRGRRGPDGIRGHWIQSPSGIVFSVAYASPLFLGKAAPGVWRGTVVPLEERVSFYVRIATSGEDGGLTAVIRNPEFNLFHGRTYRIERKEAGLTFVNQKDADSSFAGSYDAASDALTLPLLDGAPPLRLTRRDRGDAVGYTPRSPAATNYTYRQPIREDDGWRTGSLSEVGLDGKPIAALMEKILQADPTAGSLAIQSLLVARHGRLVLEEYFYGFDAERPHDTRSAGKTFAPMLVGLARERGAKVGPETPVYSLFPEDEPFARWDERKTRIRVGHLMSMTAGYDCDEDHSDDAPLNEDVMQGQTSQPDWYRYTLDAPMAREPGGDRAYYCSAELNLAGGVAAKASGSWLPELFDEAYARPLRFRRYFLNLQPGGQAYMGGGAYIRPRDQLKLGQLYLDRGAWNSRRILSREWVEQSLARHAAFEPRFGVDHEYGWGWHIHHLKVGDRAYTEYESGGNGGQLVAILPELDMVVGFTGGAYGEFRSWGRWDLELVPQYLIAAAR